MLSEQFLALVTAAQIAICEYFWIDVIVPDNFIIPSIWEDGTGAARLLASIDRNDSAVVLFSAIVSPKA